MPLLRQDDPPAVRIENPAGKSALLIVCDHASARVPAALGDLGIPARAFGEHVAIDLGAEAITLALARLLDARAVIAGFSRLVVDCNRDPADPEWMPNQSDGYDVPANRDATPADRQARFDEIFDPYHSTVAAEIDRLASRIAVPVVFSVHTFTPVFAGHARPWHAGVLWNRDGRVAVPLIAALRTHADLVVGDNEPYSGRTKAYTLQRHAHATGLPHAAIEVRQDLTGDTTAAAQWATILADALQPILMAENVQERRLF